MEKNIQDLRDGIFALRTRRFGSVAELMIREMLKFDRSKNQFHDLFDKQNERRIEVKFSTVMKANEDTIKKSNLIDQCNKAVIATRAMKSDEIDTYDFDCNIQQIKRVEFDVLYYGLFFEDKIAIFKMRSDQVLNCPGYSDFQHKGNEGEGQFHLNNASIKHHMDNHFHEWLTYEKLFSMF